MKKEIILTEEMLTPEQAKNTIIQRIREISEHLNNKIYYLNCLKFIQVSYEDYIAAVGEPCKSCLCQISCLREEIQTYGFQRKRILLVRMCEEAYKKILTMKVTYTEFLNEKKKQT